MLGDCCGLLGFTDRVHALLIAAAPDRQTVVGLGGFDDITDKAAWVISRQSKTSGIWVCAIEPIAEGTRQTMSLSWSRLSKTRRTGEGASRRRRP